MHSGYIILLVICIVALVVLTLNIAVVQTSNNITLKYICMILFIFSIFRYLTLMVYGDMPSYELLNALRYFYFATSLGLTVPTLAAIWYITPLYREKIKYPTYLLLFTPWMLFYLYVIIMQPTRIIVDKKFGYNLQLIGNFNLYLSIAQGSFVIIVLILCLVGIIKYKNAKLRSRYFAIIIAHIALTLDGLSYFYSSFDIIPQFTLTEVLGFLAILYAFRERIKVK
jgi:hypothetical protein